MTLGINVSTNEKETYHTSGPGRKMYPEYEKAKQRRDEAWRILDELEITDPRYFVKLKEAEEAEAEVIHIYRTTIGLGA